MKNIKELPNTTGLYKVQNLINGKVYIGQSVNIKRRFLSHHLCEYKNEKNGLYNTKFYQALRKYGLENFEVIVLEECEREELDKKEIEYIKKYDSFKNGYNSTEGGQNWSPNIHSKETEQKRFETRQKNKSLMSENHPRAKLTNDEVVQIRQRYIDGESIKQIYQDYKEIYKNMATFTRIVLGNTYITAGNIPKKSQKRYTNAKLTESQVKEIRRRYRDEDISYAQLGREYGLNGKTIGAVVKRITYKHID